MGHSGLFPAGHAPAAARRPSLAPDTRGSRMTARHLVRPVAETGRTAPHRLRFGRRLPRSAHGTGPGAAADLDEPDRERIPHGTLDALLTGSRP